ncbi:penicillin-insensitive murein endopeptidase [Ahrensia sp. AH-315-G08]|nr:penicillin-insensitive murein endopeptidase [Ahrensia sp. AH-315-G08]
MQFAIQAILKMALAMVLSLSFSVPAFSQVPAKKLFGHKKLPAVLKPAAHGFYSKGCVSGAVAIPIDGPNWQAMRLARNRRWGHPDLISLVIRLSQDAKKVGWNGLLVGDMSQPRGGPMLTGHASHQIGLDADIWLNQMPNKRYTYKQRQNVSAVSMLHRRTNGKLDSSRISKKTFSRAQFNLIRTAARYGQVERILIHPTIKRELCRMETGDRKWLYKVRPYWGHHYHMHVRLSCPAGSPGCRPQAKPKNTDGCGKELKYWARLLNPPKRKKTKKPKQTVKKKKPKKKKRKPQIRLADLPKACRVVLHAAAPANELAATMKLADGVAQVPVLKAAVPKTAFASATKTTSKAIEAVIFSTVTIPTPRPKR